jgi:hypothetical protein
MMWRMALNLLRSALVRALARRPRKPIRFDGPEDEFDTVTMVDGRVLRTHARGNCLGVYCCIHNPSEHPLATAPLHWRADRALMERICTHGIGHPDPDSLAFQAEHGVTDGGVHGCDGCCQER